VKSQSNPKALQRPERAIDPALTPFLDSLAELLAAEQVRNAIARQALRKVMNMKKTK
jgi:hypothetical protein